MSIAIYPGCACDTSPITLFPHIHTFIYIDSNPSGYTGFFNSFEDFSNNLTKDFKKLNIDIVQNSKNYIKLSDNNTTIHYFFNTFVEEVNNNPIILKYISSAKYLILIGYSPPKSFIELFNTFSLITSNTTYIETEKTGSNFFLIDKNINREIVHKIEKVHYIEESKVTEYFPKVFFKL